MKTKLELNDMLDLLIIVITLPVLWLYYKNNIEEKELIEGFGIGSFFNPIAWFKCFIAKAFMFPITVLKCLWKM